MPFENNYFDVLKKVIDDIETDSFWFFASFMKLDTFDFDELAKDDSLGTSVIGGRT